MTQKKQLPQALTRRHWLTLAVTALTGCGGGANTASAPGTGGTGVYAQGSISGFGSVIVNGIKFDDTAAEISMDGSLSPASDLRLGMIASIEGERGAINTLGTARRIKVWSVARGLVSSPANGQFSVAGMTVLTDNATVLDGFTSLANLQTGVSRVAVWGLQAGSDASQWRATRIAMVTDSTAVTTGLVAALGLQRSINGILLTGALAANMPANALVRVQGNLSPAGDQLEVSSFSLQGAAVDVPQQGEAELEGMVTSSTSASHFFLGAFEIDATGATLTPTGLQITTGLRLEVMGRWLSGAFKAENIELQNEQTLNSVEIEARIQAFTSVSDFVLRGQRCDASTARFSNGSATQLSAGVKVKITGTKAGDVLRVTELEFD